MGESTCLMHSVSFTSGMPNQSNNQENHVHVLGDSVSFGRFTSESLAWEKWSAFSNKRYVEEAKSYAQPGSVAQKKAFFEAHYKKVAAQKAAAAAAAAAAEQEKARSQIEECGIETNYGAHDSEAMLDTSKLQQVVLSLKLAVNEEQQIISQDAAADHSSIVNVVEELQTEKILVAADVKNKELSNNTQDLEDHVSVSEDSRTSQMDRPLLKSKLNTDQEVLQPKIRRKPAVPSFRSPSVGKKQSRIPYSPGKYVASMHSKKENMVTPRTKNPNTMETVDKKRSAPRSLYTLMKSGSFKEPFKVNTPVVPKNESAKLAPSAHSTPKRSATPMKTPSKVTNVVNKQPLATPSVKQTTPSVKQTTPSLKQTTPSLKQRMETPVHPSAVGSKTPGQKWHIFSAVSKSLSAYRNKLQSPTVSSPFTLRTEERAARRKQKLEEKFNEKEQQKAQLQTTLKEKAETEFRRLRQSFCFKARPLPSFYNGKETSKSPIKKTPQAIQRSLTPSQKPPTTTSQPPSIKKSSRRLWKTNDQNPPHTHPLAELARRINHENVSPNIRN
ncbi:hypothetical protein QVD17_09615 [Tagetes erecta]|uniref:TPX2 C-terminal domain-containing protein n=1 Tax=Tagetes erecta TaxID=13708 RepID=A0AAD8L6A9_TARER|nr:hypothetical protein QVD17_09615 [Tagetes erecta]